MGIATPLYAVLNPFRPMALAYSAEAPFAGTFGDLRSSSAVPTIPDERLFHPRNYAWNGRVV